MTKSNFGAHNVNRRDYYATGITRYDDGREIQFDSFLAEPIICPFAIRHASDIEVETATAKRITPGCVGYTVTYLTCEKLDASRHDIEDARLAEWEAEQDFVAD